jgi:DNA ligase-1
VLLAGVTKTSSIVAATSKRSETVKPEQVVEVAIDGVQHSTRYPGGVALRFARAKTYRDDKLSSQADTISSLRDLL